MFWLGLAILVWSKHEGTLLLPCVLLGCIVHVLRDQALRRSVTGMRWEIAWCAVPACVLASTWLVNASAGFENYLLTNNPGRVPVWERALAQFTDRAWPALEFLVRDIALSAQATRLVWVPFVVLSVLRPGLAFGNRFVQQTVTVLAAAIGYYVVFIGSHYDLQWQLGCAAERVFFHLWPVLFVWTGRMSAELFPALRSAPSPRAVVGAGAR
jgi:hypothetical protein